MFVISYSFSRIGNQHALIKVDTGTDEIKIHICINTLISIHR